MSEDLSGDHCEACGTPAPLPNVYWCDRRCYLIWIIREANEGLSVLEMQDERRRINDPAPLWRSNGGVT